MKTKTITLNLLVTMLMVFSTPAVSQYIYYANAYYGEGKIRIVDNEPYEKIGNSFTSRPSFAFGAGIGYSIDTIETTIKTGVGFARQEFRMHTPDWSSEPNKSWLQTYYSICIPLEVDYSLLSWLHIHAGVSNNFYLQKYSHNMDFTKLKPYSLSGFIGGDIVVMKQFALGVSFSRELTPSMQNHTGNTANKIFFHFQNILFRFNYYIK